MVLVWLREEWIPAEDDHAPHEAGDCVLLEPAEQSMAADLQSDVISRSATLSDEGDSVLSFMSV